MSNIRAIQSAGASIADDLRALAAEIDNGDHGNVFYAWVIVESTEGNVVGVPLGRTRKTTDILSLLFMQAVGLVNGEATA